MGKALSVDLRVRAVEAIGAGMSRRAATVRNTNLWPSIIGGSPKVNGKASVSYQVLWSLT